MSGPLPDGSDSLFLVRVEHIFCSVSKVFYAICGAISTFFQDATWQHGLPDGDRVRQVVAMQPVVKFEQGFWKRCFGDHEFYGLGCKGRFRARAEHDSRHGLAANADGDDLTWHERTFVLIGEHAFPGVNDTQWRNSVILHHRHYNWYTMLMYFSSRLEAGYKLAQQLVAGYRYENTVVVALSDGAVQVGRQIAAELHCTLTLLLSEQIDIPGEQVDFGTVNQSGRFTYNGMFSTGEIEAYYSEFHGYLEDQKREKISHMNQLLGSGGIVDESMLREHNVILVSDGLASGISLDAAADFLKPLRIRKLVIATPVASVEAVDRAHILGDEIHILSVTDNFLDTNHYYDINDIPSHETTIAELNEIVLNWH